MISIEDKTKCSGCTACQQVCPKACIKMLEDEEGFLYPYVDESQCIKCRLCQRVCPVMTPFARVIDEPVAYACKSKDSNLIKESSSGGIFTILATKIIQNNGVVFGAKFSEDWSVEHDYSETIEGLAAFRGSKYVQSKLGDTFSKVKDFLQNNRLVLFVGTPCQVAGLNHFLHKDYDNLYTFDVVCHSISSPKVWKYYLDYVKGNAEIVDITFRDKSQGWRNYGIHIKGRRAGENDCTLEQGKQSENLFMRGFLEDLTVRPSCSHCPARNYVTGSDIMLADCWRLEKYHPEWDDNTGMSQAIILTNKGQDLFNSINPNNAFLRKIPYNEVEDNGVHAPITKSTPPHPLRKYFFKNLSPYNVKELLQYCLQKGDSIKSRKRKWNRLLIIRIIYYIVNLCKTKRK